MQNSFKLKNECNLILFWNQVCVQKHVFEHENHFLSLQFMRSKAKHHQTKNILLRKDSKLVTRRIVKQISRNHATDNDFVIGLWYFYSFWPCIVYYEFLKLVFCRASLTKKM